MAQLLPFSDFAAGQSKRINAGDCINFMPVIGDQDDSSPMSLFSTSGIGSKLTATNTGSLIDGVYGISSSSFLNERESFLVSRTDISASQFKTRAIISNTVYDLDNESGLLAIGYSSITANNDYIVFSYEYGLGGVINSAIWSFNTSTLSFTEILSGTERNNVSISDSTYVGGRFLYLNRQNNRVYYSTNIGDPDVDLTSLNFIASSYQTDDLTAISVINNRLYVFSNRDCTVWEVTPDQEQPYVEVIGSSLDVGVVDSSSIVNHGGALYFIGRRDSNVRLMVISGGTYKDISTKEINYLLDEADLNDDLFDGSRQNVFSFSDQGREFIAFEFNDMTFCYDIASGLFHRRRTTGSDTWAIKNQLENTVFIGSSVVPNTDPATITIDRAVPDSSIGTEFGELVERTWVSSNFNSNNVLNNVREIQVIGEMDYSNPQAGYTDPNLGLSISKSSSNTFSIERHQQFGEVGVFTKIMRFLSMGIFREAFTVRLRTNNPYPHRVVKMLSKIDKGFRER